MLPIRRYVRCRTQLLIPPAMDWIFERCVTFEDGMVLVATCDWPAVFIRWYWCSWVGARRNAPHTHSGAPGILPVEHRNRVSARTQFLRGLPECVLRRLSRSRHLAHVERCGLKGTLRRLMAPATRSPERGIPVASGSATCGRQGFASCQRLARTNADVSTLLTSLTLPATSLTWAMAF
jgi:hypothetical protein